MRQIALAFLHTQLIYFAFGFVKGGWNLYFYQDSAPEAKLFVVILGGVLQGLFAVFVYGFPAKFAVELLAHREVPYLERRWIACVMIGAMIALIHVITLQGDGSAVIEFVYMLTFLGPIPHLLKLWDGPEIDVNAEHQSWWTNSRSSNK